MSTVKVTDANYEEEILKSELPVLVDFWGEGCPPCKMIAPIIEELARSYAGRVRMVKAQAEENTQQAMKLRIMAVPTLLFYENGEVKDKHVGFANKQQLETLLKKNFSV